MGTSITRQIYVISDLHLGGTPGTGRPQGRGFRLFTHTPELVSFISVLASKPPSGQRIELVINGDFVDFLAEVDPATGGWTALKADPQAASDLLERIAGPNREGPIFDALRHFLTRGHRLTLLLGNHDVELSFPPVRCTLERLLGVGSRSDFTFLYDGEAYAIGDVLIEHGNRYDAFNTNDYDALRRVRSLQSRRVEVPTELRLKACPGSELVASGINPIKEDYPFIDLLKPEGEAVVPVLLALEPAKRKFLLSLAAAASQSWGRRMRSPLVPAHAGDIAASGNSGRGSEDLGTFIQTSRPAEPDALDALLVRRLGKEGATAFRRSLSESMGDEQETSHQDISARLWVLAEQAAGLIRLLVHYTGPPLRKRLQALLQALRAFQTPNTFDVSKEPPGPYLDAVGALAKRGFKAVLFGHTHVARDVPVEGARYLNTGTWADVLRFPEDMLDGPDEQSLDRLEAFVRPLRDRSSFEAAVTHGESGVRLAFRPTFARLDFGPNGECVRASLEEFTSPDSV
jgi:UDP-2,3-diacylglucosamine pyrophosphatase LpxH